MTRLVFSISTSLDGFITGPEPRPDQALGRGGERLHDWAYDLRSFRERHGRQGGDEGPTPTSSSRPWTEPGRS